MYLSNIEKLSLEQAKAVAEGIARAVEREAALQSLADAILVLGKYRSRLPLTRRAQNTAITQLYRLRQQIKEEGR